MASSAPSNSGSELISRQNGDPQQPEGLPVPYYDSVRLRIMTLMYSLCCPVGSVSLQAMRSQNYQTLLNAMRELIVPLHKDSGAGDLTEQTDGIF